MFREMWNSTGKYDLLTWPHSLQDWTLPVFWMLAIAFIGGGIATAIAQSIGTLLNQAKIWHLEDICTEKLVAIQDKDGVTGAVVSGLFMAAGFVGSSPYYFYCTEDSDGAIRRDKVYADRSIFIHETDGTEPRLVERQYTHSRPWIALFAWTYGNFQHHFYVPEGTVRREFTMELR